MNVTITEKKGSNSVPGRLDTVTHPNGQVVTRGYNQAGQWTSIKDWNNQRTSFGWSPDGQVSSVTYPNGASNTRLFDADGGVTKVTMAGPGWSFPVTYSRGNADELTSSVAYGANNTWAYDPAQQVTSTATPADTYAFDPAGNPTSVNGRTQAFDPSGELCWWGFTTGTCGSPPKVSIKYSYDANGERTAAGSATYSFNAAGQMTTANTTAGVSSYTYSPDGLRVSKTVAGTATSFAWDATAGVPELIQDGNDYYLYGPDGLPVERIGADPTRWLFCDGTGSVTASTDTTGHIVANRSYDAWGNTISHTGTPVSLGWQSQYQDPETGLYNLWNRYYDPFTAQFTTPDPLDAITGERYGYASNDPINGSDPTGLWWGQGTFNSVANAVVSGGTFGTANCIRGISCGRDTASAYVSDQQAADFAGGVLNGVTGGLASDAMPGLYNRVNVHSGFGWAGQGVGVGASLVAAAESTGVARVYAGLSTGGVCLSGAPIGYCIVAGMLNGAGVAIGSLPWGDYGSPGAEGLATVIGDFAGIWPGVIGDCDR